MTFTELMGLTNGNYIETAGTSAKNQCVDLANAYIRYVLGFPIIEWTNAVDFPSKAGDNYDYILNTPEGIPQEGDLVIWDGQYGHIAIFIEGNADRFTSFDENYPIGSPCHVQEHNYNGVLGWLRPNRAIIAQPIAKLTLQTIIPKSLLEGEDQDLEIQQIAGLLKDGKRDNLDLQNTKKAKEELEESNSRLLGELIVARKEKEELRMKIISLKTEIEVLDERIKELSQKPTIAPKTTSSNQQPMVAPLIIDFVKWLRKINWLRKLFGY